MSRVSIYPHGLLRKSFDVAGTYSSTSSHDLKKSSGRHEPVAPIERQGNDGRGVVEALNIGSAIQRRRVENEVRHLTAKGGYPGRLGRSGICIAEWQMAVTQAGPWQ